MTSRLVPRSFLGGRHGRLLAFALACGGCAAEALPADDPAVFRPQLFRHPPRTAAPHVRWWWPGGSVRDETLRREVGALAEVGFGGVELQAFAFGLTPADVAADPRIRTVGSPEFLHHVRTFVAETRRRGMASALTLGSGWSSGGVFTRDVRPTEIVRAHVDVAGPGVVDVAVPTPPKPAWVDWANMLFPVVGSFEGPFDLLSVVAMPIVDPSATPVVVGAAIDVTGFVSGGRLVWNAPVGPVRLSFHFAHEVDHYVAGHAYPTTDGPARVVDHLDPLGFATLRDELIEPWLESLGDDRPDALFVDSFELVGDLPWSDTFAARYRDRFGYAPEPALPFMTRNGGESAYTSIFGVGPAYVDTADAFGARVREDYEDLRGTLFAESFLAPLRAAAHARGLELRLQAHGGFEQVLDGYAHADVPESEGLYARGSFDFLSLASSAAHVSGARVVSSESFVTVRPRGPNLSEDEMWMLAGRAFAAGINRPMVHGRAYPYLRTNGERFYPFGTNPEGGNLLTITSDLRLPDEDPEAAYVPGFVAALSRLGYAMTRGEPQIEIAWLLEDTEFPNATTIHFDFMPPEEAESELSLALRRAGFTYDRISRSMLASSTAEAGRITVGRASYRALLVDEARALEPEGAVAVARAVAAGVPVFFVGPLPSRSRGASEMVARDAAVQAALDSVRASLHVVSAPLELSSALAEAGLVSDVQIVDSDCVTVSRRSRRTASGDVVFLFHEYPDACSAELGLDGPRSVGRVSAYDPVDGSRRALSLDARGHVRVELPAARPVVLFAEP